MRTFEKSVGLLLKYRIFFNSYRSYASASLYVHWPFCKRRCTYCNFNKYIDKDVNHERMKQCLIKEAKYLLQLANVQEITSIYFGGGTPSLANPDTIECFLKSIKNLTDHQPQLEVTMEVNPTHVEMNNLKNFKEAGINRVSIGIQTLREQGLQILGRDHSVQESIRCVEMAKQLFPGHVSVDLIFGWPGQTLELWVSELQEILQICDNHISLYQLTIERGTHLFKLIESKKLMCLDSEVTDEMYLQAVELLEANQFERYEVSNFAKQQSYSHHNISYWTGQDYIGVGPGAHGRFTPRDRTHRQARVQTLEPNYWSWEVEQFGHATRKWIPLTSYNQLEELLMVGLRTKKGISNLSWSKISPRSIEDLLLNNTKVLYYIQSGILIHDKSGLKASKEGMNIIDSILPILLNALEASYEQFTGVAQ